MLIKGPLLTKPSSVISLISLKWFYFRPMVWAPASLSILFSDSLNMGHARDPETKEHLIRMANIWEHIARTLSHSKEEITHQFIHRISAVCAPFHDIGKYRIPDKVLFSSARFNEEERAVMDNHTLYGEEMINNVVAPSCHSAMCSEEIQFIKNIVRHHHERFDGTGLPDALSNTAMSSWSTHRDISRCIRRADEQEPISNVTPDEVAIWRWSSHQPRSNSALWLKQRWLYSN